MAMCLVLSAGKNTYVSNCNEKKKIVGAWITMKKKVGAWMTIKRKIVSAWITMKKKLVLEWQ